MASLPHHQPFTMFRQQQTACLWHMPSARSLAKEYTARSRWLGQLNGELNGGADSHPDY